ncbi:MAG: SAM-dependent methyltransferase [Saprospiraceae bacterium]|nr:SAM-dependent methyltransferase [Saprospiraceae bacterium]
MKSNLNADFWNDRYRNGMIGWDLGYPSTPIKEYVDQIQDKEIKILIPGAGNAYEAEYLFEQGFTNVNVLDISEAAITSFKSRVPDFPDDKIIHQDFFEHTGQYDLILEQTFFCALNPELRSAYAYKVYDLLSDGGLLTGVLFNVVFDKPGPPFGGKDESYRAIFCPYFQIEIMAPCYNSIAPRAGAELFIKLRK